MKYLLAITILLVSSFDAQASDAVCRILEREARVAPANYVAGVDVNGKAVASADINAAPQIVPDVIKVPLTVDLAKRVASLTDQAGLLEAPLGMVEIHKDGAVRYNDEDWTTPMKALCGQSLKATTVVEVPGVEKPSVPAMKEMKEPTRQVVDAPVKSQPEQTIAPKAPQVEQANVKKEELKIISNRPDIIDKIEGGEYRDNLNE